MKLYPGFGTVRHLLRVVSNSKGEIANLANRNQLNTVIQYIQKSYVNDWSREMIISSLELSIAEQDKAFYLYDKSGTILYQIDDAPYDVDWEIVREVLQEKQPNHKMSEGYVDQHIFVAVSPIDEQRWIEEKAIVMVSYGKRV